jgi:ssDNA-binding Zn-finger/Zn-ribbon topoisomerase 1
MMTTRTRTAPTTDQQCPACGNELLLRRNRKTQQAFWGCRSYPACAFTRPHSEQWEQLDLPCSLNDAIDLQEEVTALRRQVRHWQAQAEEWEGNFTDAMGSIDRLVKERTKTEQELRTVRTQLSFAEIRLTGLQLQLNAQQTTALPEWLDRELRKVLATSHPDRWAAGQDAAALAHEVTVGLNALRQRLGEVQR